MSFLLRFSRGIQTLKDVAVFSGNGGQARTTPDIEEATATVRAAVAGS